MLNIRKKAVFATVGVGSVLALSSMAFACTTFKGEMTATQGASVGTATGNNTGMGFCAGAPYTVAEITRAQDFTVAVNPSTTHCPASLGNSTGFGFQVLYTDSAGHCMAGTGNKIGTIQVSSGVGKGTYQIPSGAAPGSGWVCVSDNAALKGMMVETNFL